jgi:hypothetical protein
MTGVDDGADSGRAIPQSTHVPRPHEHDLPGGDLAVSSHWVHGVRAATTVPADDTPLYRLLMDVLADRHVPDTMPARLATACDDLVAVRGAVTDIERGRSGIAGVSYGLSYLKTVEDAIDEYRDRDPVRLVAVGCSASKHEDDGVMPAADRYKGSYWVGKRRYYETVGDDGRIISAKHAVLDPETPIVYYERTPDDLAGVPVDHEGRLPDGREVRTLLDEWALRIYHGLQAWLRDEAGGVDSRDVELEVLLGRDYRDRLADRGVFDALRGPADLSISYPYQEIEAAQGGMIQQIDWMGDAADAADGGEHVAD